MIVIRIKEVARERGIKSGYHLTNILGVSPSMGARLWKNNVNMIALSTLDRLCEALQCEPKDLLVYQRSASRKRRQ